MERDTLVKIFVAFFVGFNLALIISIVDENQKQKAFDNLEVLYEVEIKNEYINVRKEATTGSEKIFEALEGETYEVVDVYEGDKYYDWYKIKFGMRRTGWIASDKEEAWATIVED